MFFLCMYRNINLIKILLKNLGIAGTFVKIQCGLIVTYPGGIMILAISIAILENFVLFKIFIRIGFSNSNVCFIYIQMFHNQVKQNLFF